MKTLKKYTQFIVELWGESSHKSELEEIMDEYMEILFNNEYDYMIEGENSDNFTIKIFHISNERGEPGEEFKEQIADDNKDAANKLVKFLDARGYGHWKIDEPTYKGFTLTQTWDPRASSDTVKYHREL